jgi:hypothetical protein
VTFTAAVSNTTSGSSLVPTGTAQFYIDGVAYGSALTLDSGGHASITDNRLPVSGSPHIITVSFSNSDGNFSNSTGGLAGGQTVTPATLTVTATGVTKVYDGTTTASVNLSDNRVAGDVLTVSYSNATFADKNVGTGKAVTASGISFSGADAGNYTLASTTASTTANITARSLTVSATGINKVYNGTTTDTVTLSDNRVSGDDFTDSYTSATFADANVGTGKTVSVSGIIISGTDASNYALHNTTVTTTADITAAATTTAISAPTVAYNANGGVTVTVTSAAGPPSGSVSLTVDGDSAHPLTATLDGTGKAVFTLTSPSAATHTLSASYAAQGNYAASSASGSLIVNTAATTVSISAPDVTYNANGSVTLTVSAPAGVPAPTGSVTLSVDGGAAQSATLNSNGKATFTISSPSAGDRRLHAAYAAQGNYAASSADGNLHVTAAATTVSITAPDVTYNGNATVAVKVSPQQNGLPTPSGSITLTVAGGPPLSATLDGNGNATFTITGPDAGNYSLTATYAAQGNFAGSTQTAMLHVNPAATQVSIDAPTVTYNANGTVTVTVSPQQSGVPTPTGSVTLTVDGDGAHTQTLTLASGKAVFTLTSPSATDHSLSASYSPTNDYLTSSVTATLHVSLAPTSTTIDASSITFNEDSTVTITVSATNGAPTPSGNVSLQLDSGTPQTAALGANGKATFYITGPEVTSNPHTLTASYAAQGNDGASSSTVNVYSNQAPTGVNISAPDVTYNADGKVTVTVSSADGTPAGDVTLTVDGSTTYTTTLSGGQATFTLSNPDAATHTLHADYASQGDFAGSSTDGRLVVNPAATSVAVDAPTVTYNGDGTVTVTVSPQRSGVPTPTGSVTLTVDGDSARAQTKTLADGQATFSLSSPDAGDHTLSVSYAPTSDYLASTGSATLHVNPAATQVSIDAPTITYNADGVVTVTVSPQQDGVPTVTGNITLTVDGSTTSTAALSGGKATFTLSSPNATNHSLSATYAAQGNYAGSSASGNLHVNAAATLVSLSAPDVTYDADGMITVTVSPQQSGVPTPTGVVSLTVDDGAPLTHELSGGSWTFDVPGLHAGDHKLVATFADQGDFAGSSAGGDLLVNKANASIAVNGYSGTYDGAAHGLSGSATGVNGTDLSSLLHLGPKQTDAGHYTVTWTFDGNNDHNAASGTADIDIAKANASITVNPYSGTYDGQAHSLTGTAAGTQGEDLSSLLTFGASETDAGHSVVDWSFAGNANYNAVSGTSTLDIARALLTHTVGNDSQTYGSPADLTHDLGTTIATGVNGEALAISYSSAGDTPTADVGSYAITGAVSDGSGKLSDYDVTLSNGTLTVNRAELDVMANASSKTYGQTASDTGTVTGVLNGDGITATFASAGDAATASVGGYTIKATLSDPNGKLGDYTVVETDATLTVNKANATISVTPYSVTYDGNAHTDTGTATGVHGESLSGLDLSGTSHTNAGTFSDTWAFTDSTGNYNDATGTASDSIAKANATVAVTPYSVTYDATAHAATGTARGVVGEALSGLDLSGTAHTNAGTHSDAWTFTDSTGNYNNATDSVTDSIDKASSTTVTLGGGPYTYDGTAHTGGSGTVTGAGLSTSATSLTYSGDQVDAGTYYVTAHYAGDANHFGSDGAAVAITIEKANVTISVTPYSVTYDGNAHGATGTATGVKGESLAGLNLSGTSHTNACTSSDTWAFTDSTGNYNDATGTVNDSIARAGTSVTVTSSLNSSLVGQSVTFTATVKNTSTSPVPTGTVTFLDGSSVLASNVALVGGTATFTTSSLTAGSHAITVVYTNSDGNFQSRSSGPMGQTVNYTFSGFLSPVSLNRAFKQGSTVPLKWQLKNGSGEVVTSLSAIKSLTVTMGTTTYTLYDGTNSSYTSGGSGLQNDGSQYIFNWQTKSPFVAGAYTLTLKLADGSTRTTAITLGTTGASMGLLADSAGGTSTATTGGALLAGDLAVFVDNSHGRFTSDELARVEDAIASVESTVSPYGTNLFEVSDSADANIILDIGTTSAVGGYADGVLGCTTDAGEVTLVTGWNWYTGADAAAVGSNQYDFQTILTHELGHALGLGHSADAASVMYATLGTGVTDRVLTTADLNVPDTDNTGACGLHAAVPSSGETQASTVLAVPGQGANGVGAGASLASPQTATGNRPVLPGVPASGPKGTVSGPDASLSSLRAISMVDVGGPASGVQAGTGLNVPAAGPPAGWSATSAVAGGAQPALAAPFTAWSTHPLLSGSDHPGDSGGGSVAPTVRPAPADLPCLDSREPATQEGAPRREPTEPPPSSEQRDALSLAALDALFGPGTEWAGGPIGSDTGEPAGVGGARRGLSTTPDQGDDKDASEVQVPASGKASLFALLGALWGNLWGARTDEPESRKHRRQRRR